MKKKIITVKAVAAYNYLKSLKVKELSDEAGMAIWKNIKALRPTYETYEKDVKDVDESLKGDDAEEWEERRRKAAELEQKVNAGEAKYSKEDIAEQMAVIKYLGEIKAKKELRVNELNSVEVEVEISPISETDMLKAIKVNDSNIGIMDELSFLLAE